MTTRVADMSIDELRAVVRETVEQTLADLFRDPDDGLELREEVRYALQSSIKAVKEGQKTISAEDLATELGLDW
jgi:hypothetical protein